MKKKTKLTNEQTISAINALTTVVNVTWITDDAVAKKATSKINKLIDNL